MNKNFKIWGVSYGLVGDLIMGLPILEHFEQYYPGSYKTWVIEKKVAFMAPFFLGHPLIDKIYITDGWAGHNEVDEKIAATYDIKCTTQAWEHKPRDWYNYRDCIDETARIAGIADLNLVPVKKYPKLNRWFPVGTPQSLNTYNNVAPEDEVNDKIISILPIIGPNDKTGKSPCKEWWEKLVREIHILGFRVWQFGYDGDTHIEGTVYCNTRTYFEQVQMMLSTKLSIGTDSGNMWVLGAYSHPSIHLMTNWLPHHTDNMFALSPKNINGHDVFAYKGTDNINRDVVMATIKGIIE
jgi:ADP-heptose:LPS heptosyltransferase